MSVETEELLRIVLAVAAGALIGIEREFRDKAAGFRTLIFISLGAALFTIVSMRLGVASTPDRIAAGIVTGVGFIGAGVILRESGHIVGLTTAAIIWLTAAVGTAVGAGYYALAAGVEFVVMLVLWVFPRIDAAIDALRDDRTYEIVCRLDLAKVSRIEETMRRHGLRPGGQHLAKEGDHLRISWQVWGRPGGHAALVKELFADAEVLSMRY